MRCENCKNKHNGSYGSGRFCSDKCARGFSTKNKRKKINEKVSKKLKEDHSDFYKICKQCKKKFKVTWKQKRRKYCSEHRYCYISKEFKEKLSKIKIEKIIKGEIANFGKSIKCSYNFKDKKIKCDSKLEYVCLEYFNQKYDIIDIKRCDFSIAYKDFENVNRNFIPDFIIQTKEEIFIIECKYDKTNNKIRDKWKGYIENSLIKKEVLENYAKINNYSYFWFTNKTNKKYNRFKIPEKKLIKL